jgi:hypothetical protein
MKDISWNKVGLWAATVLQGARVVYPDLSGEAIMAAYHSNTLLAAIANVFMFLIFARAATLAKGKE